MSEMVERVADALEASFKEAVAAGAGKDFAETGVTVPARAVWLRYARAAIVAMRDAAPFEEMIGTDEMLHWQSYIDACLEDAT